MDAELEAFGLKVLRTPVQAPKANAYCERLMGTIRRECLDYVIPLSERHLRTILRGSGLRTTIRDDHTRAWGQAFQISMGSQHGDRQFSGISCQPPAGSQSRMFSAGCTMNTGWKKLLREVGCRFCGVQRMRVHRERLDLGVLRG